jgi:hypothetical protein
VFWKICSQQSSVVQSCHIETVCGFCKSIPYFEGLPCPGSSIRDLTLKSGVGPISDLVSLMAVDDARLRRARMIAEARYGFRWHLAIYIIVNLGLVAIWYYTGAGFPWPLFPILFWGLGVLGHYWGAYHTTGGGWIERETQKILREEDKGT